LGLEVVEQAGPSLERVVILPIREVGDQILSDFNSQGFAVIGVTALPVGRG
jgi:hypothetical protein